MVCWLDESGCAYQARNSFMKPFLARIVYLFRHIFTRELLLLSHEDLTSGLGCRMTMAIGPWLEIMKLE